MTNEGWPVAHLVSNISGCVLPGGPGENDIPQVDKTALSKEDDVTAGGHGEAVDLGLDVHNLLGVGLEPGLGSYYRVAKIIVELARKRVNRLVDDRLEPESLRWEGVLELVVNEDGPKGIDSCFLDNALEEREIRFALMPCLEWSLVA